MRPVNSPLLFFFRELVKPLNYLFTCADVKKRVIFIIYSFSVKNYIMYAVWYQLSFLQLLKSNILQLFQHPSRYICLHEKLRRNSYICIDFCNVSANECKSIHILVKGERGRLNKVGGNKYITKSNLYLTIIKV